MPGMSFSDLDPNQPVKKSSDFYKIDLVENYINTHLSKGVKTILFSGFQKSGKTSLVNVLPQIVKEGFIPVTLTFDFDGPNPTIHMYTQVFNSIFMALVEQKILEHDNAAVIAWSQQVNRGDLTVDISKELLEIGSRIAFYMNNPSSPVTIDSNFLDSQWKKLSNFVKKEYLQFENFVLILDNPTNLMNVDDATRNSFLRLLKSEKAPVLVCALNGLDKTKGSLGDYFRNSLPGGTRFVSTPVLEVNDIIEILQNKRLNTSDEKLINNAVKVYSVSSGNPYLVKSLLQIAMRRSPNPNEIEITSAYCSELIQSQRVNLSSSDIKKLKALESLQKNDNKLFMAAARTLLATSSSEEFLRMARARSAQFKTPTQIILQSHAPDAIYENVINSEVSDYVKNLKKLWKYGFFFLVDVDGRSINSVENDNYNLITENSNISSDTHTLILSYLQIASEEIDPEFIRPSHLSYFKQTSKKFSEDLAKFTSKDDSKSVTANYLPAIWNRYAESTITETLSRQIEQSIQKFDIDAFLSIFPLHRLKSHRENFISGNSYDKKKFFVLTLGFVSRDLLETQEFAYIVRVPHKETEETLLGDVKSWIETKSAIMELRYSINLTSAKLLEIPSDFIENVGFCASRSERWSKYFSLFKDGDFSKLAGILIRDIKQELDLIEKLDPSSRLMNNFKSDKLHKMGYMLACCGEFELAMSSFEKSHYPDHQTTINVEDDKIVCAAYLGDIEKAVALSSNILELLNHENIKNAEYWKILYIPWNSTSKKAGSHSMGPQKWSTLVYRLQHAILLLTKKQRFPLTLSEREFLSEIELEFPGGDIEKEVLIKLPHRLVAYYLKMQGRLDEAKIVLNMLIKNPEEFDLLQIECAKMDLEQLDAEIKEGG